MLNVCAQAAARQGRHACGALLGDFSYATDDDLVYWHIATPRSEKLNIDREKSAMHAIDQRVEAITRKPFSKELRVGAANIGLRSIGVSKNNGRKKIFAARARASAANYISVCDLREEATHVGCIEVDGYRNPFVTR